MTTPPGDLPRLALRPLTIVLAVQAAGLTALSGRYGFNRDELYFIAAGNHLALGYVDQPPITPLLAKISITLFGDTPVGLRVISTVMAMLTVLLVALIAREFGASRGPQLFAAGATAVSSFVLVVSHLLSTSSFDLLMWTLTSWLLLRLLRTGDGRWWVPVGLASGLALENKWLVVGLLAAVAIGLIAVGPRSVFRSWWLAAGIAAAVLIVVPNLIWQIHNGFPQLTVASQISQTDGTTNRITFIPLQLVYLSPVLVPVWFSGILALWRRAELRWARSFVLAYPVLCAALLIVGGKPYYAVPVLLIFLAAGAEPAMSTVRWFLTGKLTLGRVASWAGVALALLISIVISLPALPQTALNPILAIEPDQGEELAWPQFTSAVAAAWQQIPAGERDTGVIFTENYGEAGAIDHYGYLDGLPAAYSGHMSYSAWGPPSDAMSGPVLLVGKFTPAQFTGCRLISRFYNEYGVHDDEWGVPIRLCTGRTGPWSQLWPHLTRFYS
ncbi:MAG TPA: glycosyltransferase family 39 protein [Pseudonocardiaceae bacterium]|nr:glycosyltransferase family 39 protein [Pseudonocardiaceae bacterium]